MGKSKHGVGRAIEFYAGVGGFACAASRVWAGHSCEVTPIDIDQAARQVYELNHPHRMLTREIASLSTQMLGQLSADLWWMSPPCQPYSRRGHQRDAEDPRADSLLHLIAQIEHVRPHSIALENVAGFATSRAFERLSAALMRSGYHMRHRLLCPTELGWPNRRPRFYLLASLDALRDWQPLPRYDCSVASLIEGIEFDRSQCAVDANMIRQFASAMDRVDPIVPGSITACFGSSYGKSFLHAGSYCQQDDTWRRFAPAEVARLLGFPKSFTLPTTLSYRRLWQLLGNSLSIPVVEYVLAHLARA